MIISRKSLLVAASAFVMGAVMQSGPVAAADYPVKDVTLITHSSPGGGTDVYLREMTKYLHKYMGANFVVKNVKGGSGAKAIAELAQAPADGSTFYGSTPVYINMSLLSKPKYSYKDTEPVVNFFMDPQVVYVRTESPLKSVTEVVANAKANPGKQKWGTGSPGSLERQAMEGFKKLAGVNVTIVTHDGGGDMMINVLNGSLDLGIGEIQEISAQLKAGKVRLIGTFTDERLDEFPDVKTVKEQGVDMTINKFRGLIGPKGLPANVIKAWEDAIPKVLADPEFKTWYKNVSMVPTFMTHAKFAPFIDNVVKEQHDFFIEYGIMKE